MVNLTMSDDAFATVMAALDCLQQAKRRYLQEQEDIESVMDELIDQDSGVIQIDESMDIGSDYRLTLRLPNKQQIKVRIPHNHGPDSYPGCEVTDGGEYGLHLSGSSHHPF